MATKWKNFRKSKSLKALLIIAYLICFCAIGIITGFAPANGYPDKGTMFDTLFADNYFTSEEYALKIRAAGERLMSSFKLPVNYGSISNDEFQWSYDGFGNITEDAVAVYSFKNGAVTAEKGILPSSRYDMAYSDETYKIAFTQSQLQPHIRYWEAVQWNLRVIVVSDIALFILSVVILAILCRLISESSDVSSEKRLTFLSVFYELELAILVLTLWAAVVFLGNYRYTVFITDLLKSELGRNFFMCIFGACFGIIGLVLLWLICSVASRSGENSAARGSLLFRLLSALWRGIRYCAKQISRFARFVRELFTGEQFKTTAAKKLGIIDLIYLAAMLLLGAGILCICTGSNDYSFGLLVIVILLITAAIVITGLFIFGRSLILKDCAQLEKQISRMYDGDYTYTPALSKNSPYSDSCERLGKISAQYRENIKKSIQAERTKIELVTNVSHDLKTPLTSIISYIELLSKEELSPASADYVSILKNKSARLKAIISDVFELAKTTSGEIAVEHEKIDLSKLCHQTLGEMEDRIAKSGLEIRKSIAEPPVTIISDGKRIYRILQNLLDNALKYSLVGTRIYFTLEKGEKQAVITIKNIAAYEMTFTKEEILERFTRGDKARSTEGSGLGLSIAQGFTIACGGSFDIELDGDMFKTIITFPLEGSQPELYESPKIIEPIEQAVSVSEKHSQNAAESIDSANSSDSAETGISPDTSPDNEVKA
ncbi:MAG: sensor histidine kinase [Oscillospiraceae bacterium]